MNNDLFELDYNLFSALGGLYNGKRSPLSPLGGAEFRPLTPDVSDALRAARILDAQGQPLAAFAPALESLGQPEAYARLRFMAAAKFIDYAVYFSTESTAALNAAPSGLQISLPAQPAPILDDLKSYLGESRVQNSSFETRISADEAVVLTALIDLRRSAFLRALSDHSPVTPAPFDAQMISRTIASGLDQAQWLSGMLRTLCGLQNPLPASQVQVALSNLAAKGLLTQTERGFSLNEALAFLSDRLLVINNVIWLEGAHANKQDRVAFANMVCAQAGLNDLLCMQWNGQEVTLHATAPASLLEQVLRHLNDPEVLPPPPLVQTSFKLAVMSGPAAGQSYTLRHLTSLGREADCDIQVKDIKVSRKHAQIEKLENGYQLSDLNSTNGTYVNGIAISDPVMLKENDIITLGETRLTLVSVPENNVPVVSEATVYASGGDLPLTGVELPPARQVADNPFLEPAPMPSLAAAEPEWIPPAPQEILEPPVTIAPPPAAEPLVVPPPVTVPPPPPVVQKNICPSCGNEVAPGARFCGSCGQTLQ